MTLIKKIFWISILSFSLISCGGKKVNNKTASDVVVPDELVKSFEVQEYVAPATTEAAKATVASTAKSPKNKTAEKAKVKSSEKSTEKNAEKKDAATAAASNGFVIPNRRPKFDPVWVGEKVVLDVTWLKTRAGEFVLTVLPYKEINDRKVYHLKGLAKTADFFAFIYKAEDYVESFVDFEGWFPYKFVLKGDETRYIRNYLELYDHAAKKQYVHTVNNRLKTGEVFEEKGYKELIPFTQDSISSLYYARTQDLTDGKVIKFPMTTNGKQWETEMHVLNREEISTKMGSLKAIKTKVLTKFNGVLKQNGDSFIWFSDDERKFPIKFEAKVKIGWVTGTVKQIEQGTRPDPNASNEKLERVVASENP